MFLARAEAAYGRLQGIRGRYSHSFYLLNVSDQWVLDPIRLSTQSRAINLRTTGLWNPVLEHCRQSWPGLQFYGPGLAIPGGIFLPAQGAVRRHAYIEYDAIRYGSHRHSGGRRACYGYIDHRQPVRVDWVLSIEIPTHRHLKTICVLVQRFQAPEIRPNFPWTAWYVVLFLIIFFLKFISLGKHILASQAGSTTALKRHFQFFPLDSRVYLA